MPLWSTSVSHGQPRIIIDLRRTGLTGEVTTLEHEVGDDTVERRALVAKAVLARGELTEVASGLGDLVVVCRSARVRNRMENGESRDGNRRRKPEEVGDDAQSLKTTRPRGALSLVMSK